MKPCFDLRKELRPFVDETIREIRSNADWIRDEHPEVAQLLELASLLLRDAANRNP